MIVGSLWQRVLAWIEPEDNPTASVYGTIAVGVLLAAENPAQETYPRLVVATLVTIAVYWLAHGYSRWFGRRAGTDVDVRTRSLRELADCLKHEWPLVEGAFVPVLVLLVMWGFGASLTTAVSVDVWAVAVAVFAFELAAGLRRRLPPRELLVNAGVGLVLAASVVGVKLLLH